MVAGRSSADWEHTGGGEPDRRGEFGETSASPARAGYTPPGPAPVVPPLSSPLEQAVDPQPYNPQFQVGTGLTDWLNVLEFGAHNDGTGAAATVGAFQAANIIAASSGQLIYIPAGTYNFGGQTVTMTAGVQYLLMGTITNGTLTGGTLVSFGSSGIANPMTSPGDLIAGGTAGTPTRFAIGANGSMLTVVSGALAWAAAAPAGMVNPMTTPGDIITGGTAGAAGRLPIGGTNQILTVVSGAPTWQNAPSGFANPMTTPGDLITGGSAGAAGRLAVGSAAQVLTVVSGAPAWANAASGFANPMTTPGDLIAGGSAGAAGRLPIGGNGQVLTVSGGSLTWANSPTGFANPMLTAGDMITATTGGAAQRVALGTIGQVLTVSESGTVSWANTPLGVPLAGPTGTPVIWQQTDGSLLVVPLSYWGLTGDDGFWLTQAFSYLPQITGGGSKYGGSYNGPWIVGTIRLAALPYILQTGIACPVNAGSTVNIIGQGPGTVLFPQSGVVAITSHCAMGGPQAGAPAQQTMGCYRDFRIDGSAGAAAGIEIGGSWGRRILDVAAVNFMSPGAIGLHINNAPNAVSGEWTEKSRIRMDLMHCAQACVIENSNTLGSQASAADSAEYNDIDLYIIANNTTSPACTGVTLQGGCFLSGGSLRIRGNFPGNSGPVLIIQGNDGAASNPTFSNIFHQFIDITVESNAATNQPQTIAFANNVHNKITNCTGLLSFQFANWAPSNPLSGQLQFGGVIDGDTTLQQANQAPNGWA